VGLRVRLLGPPGNPEAIGATLRVMKDGKTGSAREIHSGSGYWSQDSRAQVLAVREGLMQILVRWPGGKSVTAKVPPGAREVSIDPSGQVKVLR